MALTRPGRINGGPDTATYAGDNALFLKVFSGEVLTSYARNNVFGPLTQSRTIQNGKSAQFPVTGRFSASHHVPGTLIEGQGDTAMNEVVVNIDDLLIADASLYDLDDAKNHYDIRSIYTTELGRAMATTFDRRIARVITLGARITDGDLEADLPNANVIDPFRTGTQIDLAEDDPSSDDLVAAVFTAAETLDSKDVPSEGRSLVCTPEMYYTLVQSSRAVNQDFNQQGVNGSYSQGQIAKLAGFNIYMSNNIAQGNVAAGGLAGERGYVFNETTTSTSAVDMTNTRMLAFQQGAVGVVKLRDLATQMTGGDYNAMYQATLMVSKMAYGCAPLRPECCVEILNSGTA